MARRHVHRPPLPPTAPQTATVNFTSFCNHVGLVQRPTELADFAFLTRMKLRFDRTRCRADSQGYEVAQRTTLRLLIVFGCTRSWLCARGARRTGAADLELSRLDTRGHDDNARYFSSNTPAVLTVANANYHENSRIGIEAEIPAVMRFTRTAVALAPDGRAGSTVVDAIRSTTECLSARRGPPRTTLSRRRAEEAGGARPPEPRTAEVASETDGGRNREGREAGGTHAAERNAHRCTALDTLHNAARALPALGQTAK
ncbi:hypothetical protein ACJJTC_006054 [Scirpophaga incertulas]